jgi:homoserine kinase
MFSPPFSRELPRDAVRVRVPASSANLGPGFDCLGLALQKYNFVTAHSCARDEVFASGEGEAYVPRGPNVEKNIAVLAARRLFDFLRMPREPLRLHLENGIPLSRGLGSSSAARVGALVAANAWAREQRGRCASTEQLLSLASELEGHPDNVAAALLGGLTVAGTLGDQVKEVRALRFRVERFPRFVAFVPQEHLETKTARGVLPDAVPRADAIFNVGATAMLLSALQAGAWDEAALALGDRLHQPFRAPLIPAFEVLQAAMRGHSEVLGVTISGAGPTVLIWLRPDADAAQVLASSVAAAQAAGIAGGAGEVEVDLEGCVEVGHGPLE